MLLINSKAVVVVYVLHKYFVLINSQYVSNMHDNKQIVNSVDGNTLE